MGGRGLPVVHLKRRSPLPKSENFECIALNYLEAGE